MDIISKIADNLHKNSIFDGFYYSGSFLMTNICPVTFCRIAYRLIYGRKLNLKTPASLDEKSIWLKLNVYKNDAIVHKCVDKYRVSEYVTECGCPEILNGLYGVWDSVDDIEWEILPDQFVLKSTHASGDVQICKDKQSFDVQHAKKVLRKSLKRDYSVYLAELMYKDVPRKVICEHLLVSTGGGDS